MPITRIIAAKFAFLLLLLVSASSIAADGAAPKPHLVYFYNPGCRLCIGSNKAVSDAEAKYASSITLEKFDTSDPDKGLENVDMLFGYLDKLGVPEDVTPMLAIVIGYTEEVDGKKTFKPTRVLLDGEEIIEKLDKAVADALKGDFTGGTKEGAGGIQSAGEAEGDSALLADPDSAEPLGLASQAVFFASETALAATPADSGAGDAPKRTTGRAAARAKNDLRFAVITFNALADSVNPCAFATIIILVAMMSSAKRTRNEIIVVCLSFTVSVYITYYCIGLFLYRVIFMLRSGGGWYLVAADLVYYAAFALCVIFAILSIKDAVMIFMGRSAEEMTLQLPKSFKKRMNVMMAKGVRARWLAVGVFIAGAGVSFLEAACTGQVYLPTLMMMAEVSTLESLLLLAWYNLVFVSPLLVIFVLVLFGMTSSQLADFFKRYIGWTKVALALVFIIMAFWVWNDMYWPPGYRGNTAAEASDGR